MHCATYKYGSKYLQKKKNKLNNILRIIYLYMHRYNELWILNCLPYNVPVNDTTWGRFIPACYNTLVTDQEFFKQFNLQKNIEQVIQKLTL